VCRQNSVAAKSGAYVFGAVNGLRRDDFGLPVTRLRGNTLVASE
jgi:hypothetical protein